MTGGAFSSDPGPGGDPFLMHLSTTGPAVDYTIPVLESTGTAPQSSTKITNIITIPGYVGKAKVLQHIVYERLWGA